MAERTRLQFLEQERVEIHRMLDTAGIGRGVSGDLSITTRLSGLVDKYNARDARPNERRQIHEILDGTGIARGSSDDFGTVARVQRLANRKKDLQKEGDKSVKILDGILEIVHEAHAPLGDIRTRVQWLANKCNAKQRDDLAGALNSITESLDQAEVPPDNKVKDRVQWLIESWRMARRRGERVAEILDAAGTSPEDGTNAQRVKTLINCVAALSDRAEPITEILRVLDAAMPTTGSIAQRVQVLADAAGAKVYDEKGQIREILNTAGIPHTGALVARVRELADRASTRLQSVTATAIELCEIKELLDTYQVGPVWGISNTQRLSSIIAHAKTLDVATENIEKITEFLDLPKDLSAAQRLETLSNYIIDSKAISSGRRRDLDRITEILNVAKIDGGDSTKRVQWLADIAERDRSSIGLIKGELRDCGAPPSEEAWDGVQWLRNRVRNLDIAFERRGNELTHISQILDRANISAGDHADRVRWLAGLSNKDREENERVVAVLGAAVSDGFVSIGSSGQRVQYFVDKARESERERKEIHELLDEKGVDRETKYGNAPIARIRWVLDRPIAEGQFSSQLRRIEEMLDAESVGGAFESTAQRVENLCSRFLCAEKTATDHGRERASIVEMLDNACAFPPENAGSVSHLSLATRVKWLADQLEAADTHEDKESAFKRHGEELNRITSTLNEAKIRPGSPAVRVRSLANIAKNRESDKDNAKDEVSDLHTTVKEMGNTIDEAREALNEVNAPFAGSIPARIRALRVDELQTIGKILSDYRVPPLHGTPTERVNGIVDYWHNMQQDGQELTKALIFPPGESIQAIIYPTDMPIGSVASNLKWLIDRVKQLTDAFEPNTNSLKEIREALTAAGCPPNPDMVAVIRGLGEAHNNSYSRWQTSKRELKSIMKWRNFISKKMDEAAIELSGQFQLRVERLTWRFRDMKSTIGLLRNDRNQLGQMFMEAGVSPFGKNHERLRWLIDRKNGLVQTVDHLRQEQLDLREVLGIKDATPIKEVVEKLQLKIIKGLDGEKLEKSPFLAERVDLVVKELRDLRGQGSLEQDITVVLDGAHVESLGEGLLPRIQGLVQKWLGLQDSDNQIRLLMDGIQAPTSGGLPARVRWLIATSQYAQSIETDANEKLGQIRRIVKEG